jgi:hypothetical protein
LSHPRLRSEPPSRQQRREQKVEAIQQVTNDERIAILENVRSGLVSKRMGLEKKIADLEMKVKREADREARRRRGSVLGGSGEEKP